jgi:RNA polymerase sigma-70 factor (ECF subfamily)
MNEEERKLIEQAQAGNRWAFERIVSQYERKVLSLAYQLVGNTQDAEDIYQEAFMRVYRNIGKFRFQSDFYTWLYRIVVNCAISYRKKRTRHLHRSIDEAAEKESRWHWTPTDDKPGPDRLVMNAEITEKIDATLHSLSLMQRTVFVLRFFQDFKIKEIASIIGCSEGTVKNYLFRGTQKMRKNLSAYVKA